MKADLVIKNAIVVTEGGPLCSGVAVRDGKTVAIARDEYLPEADRVIDAKGLYLLPGGVDPHVHFREPTKPVRETFFTGTCAAASGGVTTVCEHPISLPPQFSPEILHKRMDIAAPQSVVDYAFFGAAGADKLEYVESMGKEPIVAFKTFFHAAPEGREQEFVGLTMENDGKIFKGFEAVAKTGKILAVHAENNDLIAMLISKFRTEGKVSPGYHALSRPPVSEYETVAKVLEFSRVTGTRVELAHISTPEACELVKQAKARGQEVYLETCPQYLFLTIEDLEKHGPYAKCNPPVREKHEVQALWEYVKDGTVDFVGSDHGPYLTEEKERGHKDIFAAPSGFPGIDLRMPLMLTAVKEGRITLDRAVYLLSTGPAKIYGLYPQKGAIRVGGDADYTLVDMDNRFTVRREAMYTMSKDSARVYEGWELYGGAIMTFVRGRAVMEHGKVDLSAQGWGKFVAPIS